MVARRDLERWLNAGLSHQAIADRVGVSKTTVRYWVQRYQLASRRTIRLRASAELGPDRPPEVVLPCWHHGSTTHRLRSDGIYRCARCASEAVSRRRRRVKDLLVSEAGGRCGLCGYDRHPGALAFHHLDPAVKAFEISARGLTRSLDDARAEAAKCVLLCCNCHAEVEAGIVSVGVR